jgi:SagB-type dehydrogenase family enzyme
MEVPIMDMPDYSSIHELQTASSLVIVPMQTGSDPEIGVYEFISKSFARCPINAMYWLSYFKEPKTRTQAYRDHPNLARDIVDLELDAFVGANFLTQVGSTNHKLAASFAQSWEWDISTALFHFTVYDNTIMSDTDARQKQLDRLPTDPPPVFWWKSTKEKKINVDVATLDLNTPLFSIMRKRRTNRTSAGHALQLNQVARCLFAGLGIVGTVKATSGEVPLSMTPSGGARNPYEAYVIIRRNTDIEPGVYHYCAAEQVLEKVNEFAPDTQISGLFGGQDWFDDMSTVIVLVAVLERTMWKYQDPNAYRVVLMEAGHIGQNIMLAATEMGLTACPSAAMTHSKVSSLLKLENAAVHVPIYALSLDEAGTYDRDIQSFPTVPDSVTFQHHGNCG